MDEQKGESGWMDGRTDGIFIGKVTSLQPKVIFCFLNMFQVTGWVLPAFSEEMCIPKF